MRRRNDFIANADIPAFLDRLNELVLKGEQNVQLEPSEDVALFLIVGAPRSGTTLLLEWMGQIGLAYPTNIAARFWRTPAFAGMLQRLLTDPNLDYRDELIVGETAPFTSTYGKTKGVLSPHEFSYFIREYFPVTVGERLTDAMRLKADVAGFVRAVRLFGGALGQSVVMKGLLLQYELDSFRNEPNVIVVHVYRDEVENICSLYHHRQTVAGDSREWISVRPPEYEYLKTLSPIEQVAGQVHCTNAIIRSQLASFPASRVISISHEEFCENPKPFHESIQIARRQMGLQPLAKYDGPSGFEISRYSASSSEYRAAKEALAKVVGRLR